MLPSRDSGCKGTKKLGIRIFFSQDVLFNLFYLNNKENHSKICVIVGKIVILHAILMLTT